MTCEALSYMRLTGHKLSYSMQEGLDFAHVMVCVEVLFFVCVQKLDMRWTSLLLF